MRFLRYSWLFWLLLLPLAAKAEPEFRLTYSIFFPATHIHTKLAAEWADEIYKRTDGRVAIEIFPGGVLTGSNENYECVVKGVSDLGMSCFSYSRGMFPLIEGLDLPLGYANGRQATRIANAYYRRFMPAELSEVQIMYLHAHGPGVLAVRKPVNTMQDLKGLSIRGTGISALVIRALGANAIGMGQPDTYEALRKGVVDGTLCPVETLKSWRQGEVISEVTVLPAAGYTTAMFVAMNLETWRALPQDIQEIIQEVNDEWIDKHGEKWDEADAVAAQFLEELDKPIHTIPPQEDAIAAQLLQPLLNDWAESVEARGLPGREALDFLKNELSRGDALSPLPPVTLNTGSSEAAQHSSFARRYHIGLLFSVLAAVLLSGLFTIRGGSAQKHFWRAYHRIVEWLCVKLALLAGIALIAIIALTIWDIIGRRFGAPVHGAMDLIQLLACFATAVTLPYVTAVKGHIAVEFFFQRLRPRTRVFWDTLNRLSLIVFFLYLAIASFNHGARLLEKHAVALSIGLPIFWILWVMGGAFCLVILVIVYNLTHPGHEMIRP